MQTKHREITLILLLAVCAFSFLWLFTDYTSDDAFITFRYAKNIAAGNGWVFNIGEKVQGTSSPLFTIICTVIIYMVGPDALPSVIRLILLLSSLASTFLLWKILYKVHELVRFVVVILFALYPKIVLISVSGMEAPLVVMLMLLSYFLVENKYFTNASVIFGLLLLCRIDSIAWIIILILSVYFAIKKFPFKLIITMLAVYIPWLIFSKVYFGSILPHSVVAKYVSWQHLFPLFDPIRVLSGYFPFQGLEGYPITIKYILIGVMVIPVVVELIMLIRDKSLFLSFPLFFILYNLFYSFGRVVMADWYYLPGYVTYFISLGLFANHLFNSYNIKATSFTGTRIVNYSTTFALILFLYLGAIRWADNPGDLYIRQNKQLGLWLKHNAKADASVLVEPIGYIGWESDLYIHDYIGLVSPQILAARKQSPDSDSWFLKYVRNNKPDYIVFRNWEIPHNSLFHGHRDGILQSSEDKTWFNNSYAFRDWNPEATKKDSVYLVIYQNIN